MAEILFRLKIETGEAKGKLAEVEGKGKDVEAQLESPTILKVNVSSVLGSLRDIVIVWQAVARVIGQVKQAVSEYVEVSNVQEDAEVKLAAALKNTGKYSDEAFESLKNYASEIQNITRYGDEAIISAMALGQNIADFAAEDLPKATKAAIGLTAALNIDLNTSMMLIARARKGQTQTLTRYGLVLDTTATKEEQFAELLEIGAKKFQIATDEAKSGSGALEQYSNLVGDAMEKVGDFIKLALVPLTNTLRPLINMIGSFFRSLTETSLEATIRELEELGAAAEDILVLKKFNWQIQLEDINAELKKAGINYEDIKDVTAEIEKLAEDEIALIKIKATLLTKEQTTLSDFIDIYYDMGASQEDINRLIQNYNGYLMNSENETEAIKDLWGLVYGDILDSTREVREQKKDLSEYTDLLIERETLENKINKTIDIRSGKSKEEIEELKAFYAAKIVLDRQSKLTGIALLKDKLAEERKYYKDLGELTEENEKEKIESYARILEFEKQIAKERKAILDKEAKIKEDEEKKEEREAKEKYRKEKALLQKLSDLRTEFDIRSFDQTHSYHDSQIEAINRYYRIRHDDLIEAGYTEQEIQKQKQLALAQFEDKFHEGRIRAGSKLFGDLAKIAQEGGKKYFAVYKALSLIQTAMDGISAATAAWKFGMQFGGPILAGIMMAASIGVTAVRLKELAKMKYAKGGFTGYAVTGTEVDETGEKPVGIVHEEELVFQRPLVERFGGFLAKLRSWMMGESPGPVFALAGGGFSEILPEMPIGILPFDYAQGDSLILDKLAKIEDAIKDNQINIKIEDNSDLVGFYRYYLKAKDEYENRGL